MQRNLVKLVSSWPKLHTLYIAGDTNGPPFGFGFAPATCAIQYVIFERLTGNYQFIARIFAGSAHSFVELKAFTLSINDHCQPLDSLILPILPSIESLEISGYNHPSTRFLTEELCNAGHLRRCRLRGHNKRSNKTMIKEFSKVLLKKQWSGIPWGMNKRLERKKAREARNPAMELKRQRRKEQRELEKMLKRSRKNPENGTNIKMEG